MKNVDAFEKDLIDLINKHSIDNTLGTPDYILAGTIVSHLIVLRGLINGRDYWFGYPNRTGANGVGIELQPKQKETP